MRFRFECRNTRLGGYTRCFIFQLNNSVPVPIRPSTIKHSKSETHWTEEYDLDEGHDYLFVIIDISNRGHHYCTFYTARVHDSTLKTIKAEVYLTQDVLRVMCPCLLSRLNL